MKYLYTMFGVIFGFASLSQNPSDDCTGIPSLTVSTKGCSNMDFSLPGTYDNSSLEASSCYTVGTKRDNGWYQFTASLVVTNIDVSNTNPAVVVTVFSSCAGGSELACDFQSAPTTASISLTTVPGTTYFIQIHRVSGNNGNTLAADICVYEGDPPPTNNDPCSSTALATSITCINSIGTNAGATDSGNAPGCADYLGGNTWWTSTIPAAGNITFTTSNNGGFTDDGLAV
jgi:hypothetical protein